MEESSSDDENSSDFRDNASIILSEMEEIRLADNNTDDINTEVYDDTPQKNYAMLITVFDDDRRILDECVKLLRAYEGDSSVYFDFRDKGKRARFDKRVDLSDEFLRKLYNIIDRRNIQIKEVAR